MFSVVLFSSCVLLSFSSSSITSGISFIPFSSSFVISIFSSSTLFSSCFSSFFSSTFGSSINSNFSIGSNTILLFSKVNVVSLNSPTLLSAFKFAFCVFCSSVPIFLLPVNFTSI